MFYDIDRIEVTRHVFNDIHLPFDSVRINNSIIRNVVHVFNFSST